MTGRISTAGGYGAKRHAIQCVVVVVARAAAGRENLPGFGEGRVDGTGSFDANGLPGCWLPSTFLRFQLAAQK